MEMVVEAVVGKKEAVIGKEGGEGGGGGGGGGGGEEERHRLLEPLLRLGLFALFVTKSKNKMFRLLSRARGGKQKPLA
jgi:hypothetical protein